jgi:anti-anti-sigma regulatory factor
LASSAPGPVTLDLKTVERIDSSGIALCIGFVKECALLKKPCVIEASEELHKLFNVMKLNLFFDLREVTAQ